MKNLFIADELLIGFKNCFDDEKTKLAFITCKNSKGIIKQEKSWNNWRDDNSDIKYCDNKPTSGFILNKSVGGLRNSYYHYPRNEYIRIFDPRGFEIEITVPNLLFILKCYDCSKSVLQGKFVYAWDKQKLVLLPVISDDYKNAIKFTSLQFKTIDKKNIKEGFIYLNKQNKKVLYLGNFSWNCLKFNKIKNQTVYLTNKKYVFVVLDEINNHKNDNNIRWVSEKYWLQTDLKNLSEEISDDKILFKNEYEQLLNSFYVSKVKKLKHVIINDELPLYQNVIVLSNGHYYSVLKANLSFNFKKFYVHLEYKIENNKFIMSNNVDCKLHDIQFIKLFLVFENGKEIEL